jgi:hypothetical protein
LANDDKIETYEEDGDRKSHLPKLIGLGAVSVASAVAGGLAVAWWYRKTLTKLQNPIATVGIQKTESDQSDGNTAENHPEPPAAGFHD